jgi:hypothetical protein
MELRGRVGSLFAVYYSRCTCLDEHRASPELAVSVMFCYLSETGHRAFPHFEIARCGFHGLSILLQYNLA